MADPTNGTPIIRAQNAIDAMAAAGVDEAHIKTMRLLLRAHRRAVDVSGQLMVENRTLRDRLDGITPARIPDNWEEQEALG